MSLIVQKFGGTSVGDIDKMRRCAERAIEARDAGHDVVVVVSAMGKTTDGLIALARTANDALPRRELDMLLATGEQASAALMSMTLQSLGRSSVAFTGQQIGLATTDAHTRARIDSIDADRIRRCLTDGRIVVVAGFQGVSRDGDITTLGRGGSDLTAVALAAALRAEVCEIFTDVDGVYTADTRVVPHARKLERISYEQMLELASLGAKVLHPRAALCGRNFNVPIHVRHAHRPDSGTMVIQETSDMEQIVVSGAALKRGVVRVSLLDAPNTAGAASHLFDRLAEADVFVDDIIQNEVGADRAAIAITVESGDADDAHRVARSVVETLGAGRVDVEHGLAKVSVVGVGMRTHTGVAATMFRALADAGINVRNVTTSEIKISCIVNNDDGERALRVVHDAFNLAGVAAATLGAP